MRRNSKVNNKGFSLVELIVTIAILAIVVAPLLNAFVISARTNAKAREKLYVTTIAENLMEGIEQLSLDELAYQFNYPNQAFDLVTSSNISKVPGAEGEEASIPAMELTLENKNDGGVMTYSYAPALTIEDVRRLYPTLTNPQDLVSASVVSGAAGDYTFVGQNSHKYYFLLNNLSTGTSGGSATKEYSALISVDAHNSAYSSSENKKYEYYNENSTVADLTPIDTVHDAIFAESSNVFRTTEVVSQIQSKVDLYLETEYPIASSRPAYTVKPSDLSREINVDIKKELGVTSVSVCYSYIFKHSFDGSHTAEIVYDRVVENNLSDLIFYNYDEPENELENIYIMYKPWYVAKETTPGITDKIVINNEDLVECTVHIIKQLGSDLLAGDYELAGAENNYRVQIVVNEPANDTIVGRTNVNNWYGLGFVDLKTNLYVKYENGGSIKEVGGNMSGSAISQSQCDLVYNSRANKEVFDLLCTRDLTESSAMDRLYEVTVAIYDNSVTPLTLYDATPLGTFSGGMMN